MRLKHLSLQGYKSFAGRTEFLFSSGITAIVGPNGSGKSNVADGIRWVLGEQSLQVLRGKSTADMIFAGGRRRAQAGMAEVSLTFDNADGWLPIDFSEVTITRRAYRAGDNEYLINGSRVRLRDIAELLAESGLSQRAYAVIGQGLVDTALTLRPQERRTLFEEAAGITFYRARREEAVRRLDETQRNLERVRDIINEITPRLQRLEVEAQRVAEHERLTAHLRRLLRTWYGYGCRQQQMALTQAQARLSALGAELEAQQARVAALSERLSHLRAAEAELRANLRDWHRENGDLHDLIGERQRELAVAEERLRLTEARHAELLEELGPLEVQHRAQGERLHEARASEAQWAAELARRREELERLEAQWAAMQEEVAQPMRQQARVEQALRVHRAEIERLGQAARRLQSEAARRASERAVAEERSRQALLRFEEAQAELAMLADETESRRARVAVAKRALEESHQALAQARARLASAESAEGSEASEETTALMGRREQLARAIADGRAQATRLEAALVEVQAEVARLSGERDALRRMEESGAAYGSGVQRVLEAQVRGVLGPLAGLLDIPQALSEVVAQALGEHLRAVVVERAALAEPIGQLLEGGTGRVTLLPLDGLRQPPTLPPGAVALADQLACEPAARPAVEAVLGSVALCRDLASARALLPQMPPGSVCLIMDGTVLHTNGAVTVGRVGEVLPLAEGQALDAKVGAARARLAALEQERRALAAALEQREVDLQQLDAQLARVQRERERAREQALGQLRIEAALAAEAVTNRKAELEREQAALRELAARRAKAEQHSRGLAAERERLATLVATWQAESAVPTAEERLADQGSEDSAATEDPAAAGRGPAPIDMQRLLAIEREQAAHMARVARLEPLLAQLAERVSQAREQAAAFERDALGKARTGVAVAEEAWKSQQAACEREEALLARLEAQIAARRQRVEELRVEREGLTVRLRQEGASLEALREQAEGLRARIGPAEDELARLTAEMRALEAEERHVQGRVREAEARKAQAQLDADREQDRLRSLLQRIEEELGLVRVELAESVTAQTTLPLRPLVSDLPLVEELPEGLELEIQQVKAGLRKLQGVNPGAPREYEEVRARYQFLQEQCADLEAASGRLRQAVAELDELMQTAFRETFERVAEGFTEVFTALFNGGSARLELVEPDDLMNSGVEIVAQPPGKRSQRLALLSGGERALTAVALLFALLRVSPTPFCVLDEVDAMLDEANVTRFRALLQELARQTQFVVITHNRVTVEAADTVYGVSMGLDGVSQVVSLRLA